MNAMHPKLLVAILVVAILLPYSSHGAAAVREGEPAPLIRAQLIGGGRFDSASQRGKVVIVNFWATWCEPCREEMPVLDAFYRAHRDKGLEVLAISIDESRDLPKIQAVMKDYSFPAALRSASQVEGYGRLWRVPITFVIDRAGVLRFDGTKFVRNIDLPALDKIVLPLLQGTP